MPAAQDASIARLWYLALIVALTISAIAFLSFTLYPSSGRGVGYLIGGWLGCLLISSIVVLPFTRRPEQRSYRAPAMFTLAFLIFAAVNLTKLTTALETKEALSTLATVSGPEGLAEQAANNPDNQVLQILNYGTNEWDSIIREVQKIVVSMTPPTLSVEIDFYHADAKTLTTYYNNLIIAETNADSAPDQIKQIFNSSMNRVKSFVQKMVIDPSFKKDLLRGFSNRYSEYQGYFERLMTCKELEFSLLSKLIVILIGEHGHFEQNSNGQIQFENPTSAKQFNEILKKIQNNSKTLENLIAEGDAIDARYQEYFQKIVEEFN